MRTNLERRSKEDLTDETFKGFGLLEQANLSLLKENEWLKNELKGQIETVAIHKNILKSENKILRLKNRLLEIKYASELNKHQLELEKLRNSFGVSKLQVPVAPPPPLKPAPPHSLFPTIPIGTKSWGTNINENTESISHSYCSVPAEVNSGSSPKVRVKSVNTPSNKTSSLLTDASLAAFIPARILGPSSTLNRLPPYRPPTKAESSPETRRGSSVSSTSSPSKTESATQSKIATYQKANRKLSPKKRIKLVDDLRSVKDDSSTNWTPHSSREISEIEEKVRKTDVIAKNRATNSSQGVKPDDESQILANLDLSFNEPEVLRKRSPLKVKANDSKKRKKNGMSILDEKTMTKSKKARTSIMCVIKNEQQEDAAHSIKENTDNLKLSQQKKEGANVPAAKLSVKEVATIIRSAAPVIQSDEKQEALALEESITKHCNPRLPIASDSVVFPKGLSLPNEIFQNSKLLSGVLPTSQSPTNFCPSSGPLKPPTADTIKPLAGPRKPYVNSLNTNQQHEVVQQPPSKKLMASVVPKKGARPIIPVAPPSTGLPILRKGKKTQTNVQTIIHNG